MILFYFSLMFQFFRNPSLNKTKQKHEKQKQNKHFFKQLGGEERGTARSGQQEGGFEQTTTKKCQKGVKTDSTNPPA